MVLDSSWRTCEEGSVESVQHVKCQVRAAGSCNDVPAATFRLPLFSPPTHLSWLELQLQVHIGAAHSSHGVVQLLRRPRHGRW